MLQEGNHVRPLAASLLPTYSVNHGFLFSLHGELGSSSSHAEFVVAERPFFSLGSSSSNAEFVVANHPPSQNKKDAVFSETLTTH